MPRDPTARRWQFSIRLILLVATLSAVAVACWKAFVWEPPTHSIALYEKAAIFYGRTARIGPNQIRIESIARNDRDGSIRVESGRGQSLDVPVSGAHVLINCASWLDVAQIDLRPGGDLLEILEVRIFDHAQRELLSRLDPAFGWNVVSPNLLQIYGLQRELPETVDVWLRVHSYAADDDVYELPPTAGASVDVDDQAVTLHEVQAGFVGWSSADGFLPLHGRLHPDSAFEIRWKPSGDDRHYQIAAVTDDGKRAVDDLYYEFNSAGNAVVIFPVALESIDHLEIRPFGGKHRFVFDGIRLPTITSKTPFAATPTAVVNTGGKEVTKFVREFQPLDLRLRLVDGNFGRGSSGGSTSMSLIPRPDGPIDRGQTCSLILDERGIGSVPFQFRFRQPGNRSWVSALKSTGGAVERFQSHSDRAKLSSADRYDRRHRDIHHAHSLEVAAERNAVKRSCSRIRQN